MRSRNRLTPFLVIILIVLIWVLIGVIAYKLMDGKTINIKKLKLDDDLVQELYSYISDEDIILFSNNEYDVDNLPGEYLIRKASFFMTTEDIEFLDNKQIVISYESLDSAIKMALGPDIKYNLKNFNGSVDTDLELEDDRLRFNIHYDEDSNSYVGIYQEIPNDSVVKVKHELTRATKTDTVNLRVSYIFYKEGTKYQICNDSTCSKIVKEVDNLNEVEYEDYIDVSLMKASDGVYYYYKNS